MSTSSRANKPRWHSGSKEECSVPLLELVGEMCPLDPAEKHDGADKRFNYAHSFMAPVCHRTIGNRFTIDRMRRGVIADAGAHF